MQSHHTLTAAIVLMSPLWAHAEISSVTLNKVDQDLYQTSDGTYIQTNYCFEEANRTVAVLKFEKYACSNQLRFNEQTVCEVIDVLK